MYPSALIRAVGTGECAGCQSHDENSLADDVVQLHGVFDLWDGSGKECGLDKVYVCVAMDRLPLPLRNGRS